MAYSYLDFLAYFGISSAHPGGYTLTKDILRELPISSVSSVLDAGCGTGKTSVYIAKTYGCEITAIDYNPIMIRKAANRIIRERAAVSLIQGSVEALPFKDEAFTIVLSESVIAFTNKKQTIGEFQRTLREGGYLACTEMTVERPLLPEEKRELQALYGTIEFLTEQQWKQYFHSFGFSDIHVFKKSTVAQALQENKEAIDYDISPNLNPKLYSIWATHEKILLKYQHVLGHRTFICKKVNKKDDSIGKNTSV